MRKVPYIYRFFQVAIVCIVAGTGLSSCGSSKHASGNTGNKQHLSDDDIIAFKSSYYEASTKKILENYDEALSAYKQCLIIDPENAAANYEIADIFEFEKQADSALIYSSKAAQLDPSNVWYQELYAQCLQENGRYKEVADVYNNLLKQHPTVSDYYYKLAISQLQAGQLKDAAQTYSMAEEKLGFNEQLAINIVDIYERAKDYQNAEKEINELIHYNPKVPQYYDMLGNLYDMQGQSDKAFEVYQKMEKQYPDDPMVHLSLADYYRTGHNDKMAFVELKLAFEQPSLDVDTKRRILLTGFYETSTGTDSIAIQGIVLCELMVKANPKEPGAHITYGDFLVRDHDLINAREQYRIAVSQDSSSYIVWQKLMDLDNQLADYLSLANTSKQVISLFPDNSYPYVLNGFANIELKKNEEAINSLHEGITYATDDTATLSEIYSLIGEANNNIKNYSPSDSAYEAAIKLNPNNMEVLNNYSYYLSLRDTNLAEAAAMSKRSNDLAPNNYTYEDTYAWIMYKSGKYQEAKDWEDKSLKDGGQKDNSVLDHYGDILFKLGSASDAVEYWKKAKEGGMNSDLLDKKIKDKQLYEK